MKAVRERDDWRTYHPLYVEAKGLVTAAPWFAAEGWVCDAARIGVSTPRAFAGSWVSPRARIRPTPCGRRCHGNSPIPPGN